MTEEQTSETAGGQPRTVPELLERINRDRAPLEQAVANMSGDDLLAMAGDWSVKDHLAHVAAWERRLLAEMRGDHAAERFGLDEVTSASAETDDLNALLLARHQDDSPTTVRAEFRAAGEAVRAAFAQLTDANLTRPVRPDDPAVDTLVDLISWDTYRHYPEHTAAITNHP